MITNEHWKFDVNESGKISWALPQSTHLHVIELLGNLGALHEAADNSTLFIKFFRRQLDWSEKILPFDHPLWITYLESVLRIHTKIN
jgi:hypothetical protein